MTGSRWRDRELTPILLTSGSVAPPPTRIMSSLVPPMRAGLLARALASALLATACASLLAPAAAAQEIRGGVGLVAPSAQALPTTTGWGLGLRWVTGWGLGLGLDYDRHSGDQRFSGAVCRDPDGVGDDACVVSSALDMVTLSVIAELVTTDEWRVRFSFGRSAGRITASGHGVDTGRPVEVIEADRGAPLLSWNRGSDGSVMGLEILRRLPTGPVPMDAQLTFRRHRADMEGCRAGEFPLYCGDLSVPEMQLGLRVAWPAGTDDG